MGIYISSVTYLKPLSEINLSSFSHMPFVPLSISKLFHAVRNQKHVVCMRFLLTSSRTHGVAAIMINVLNSSTPFRLFPVSLLDYMEDKGTGTV